LAKAFTNSEFAIGQRLQVEENCTFSEARLSQAGSHAVSQAGSQVGSRARFQSPACSCSNSVDSTGITAGSKGKYRSISRQRPYIVPYGPAQISMYRR
jgi:hypothetical protein